MLSLLPFGSAGSALTERFRDALGEACLINTSSSEESVAEVRLSSSLYEASGSLEAHVFLLFFVRLIKGLNLSSSVTSSVAVIKLVRSLAPNFEGKDIFFIRVLLNELSRLREALSELPEDRARCRKTSRLSAAVVCMTKFDCSLIRPIISSPE